MRNWVNDINLDEKQLAWFKHLSKKEIQRIVAEKFEYFSSLIKYSKNSWLKMKPYQIQAWEEWTFACWLWEEWNAFFNKYMEWKIKFSDIPEEYFEPKYLYYWLPWLISKDNDVLWPIVDHELEHAESSDYWDMLINSREAVLHNFPVTTVWMFFNAFEDIYMGKKQIAKWRAKRLGVQNLYKDMFTRTGTLDARKKLLKLDQFARKALHYWLNKEFPLTFDVNYIVDEDVQEEFDKFIEHLDEIVDVTIDNKERIKRKNEILWPIIERLGNKDMDRMQRERIKQQIQQERREQQQQQVQKTQEWAQKELSDALNQQEANNWGQGEWVKQVQEWTQEELKDTLDNNNQTGNNWNSWSEDWEWKTENSVQNDQSNWESATGKTWWEENQNQSNNSQNLDWNKEWENWWEQDSEKDVWDKQKQGNQSSWWNMPWMDNNKENQNQQNNSQNSECNNQGSNWWETSESWEQNLENRWNNWEEQDSQWNSSQEWNSNTNMSQSWNSSEQSWNSSEQSWNSSEQSWNSSEQSWNSSEQSWNNSEQSWNSSEQSWNSSEQSWNNSEQSWNSSEQSWNSSEQSWNSSEQSWNNSEQSWNSSEQSWNNSEQSWNSSKQSWKTQNNSWSNSSSNANQTSQWWNQQMWNESEWLWISDKQLEDEIEKRLQNMSDKEKQQLIDDIKDKIDQENLKEHWEDLKMQKKILDNKNWDKENLWEWTNDKQDDWEPSEEQNKLQEQQQEQLEEMEKQWENIEKAVEKREKDIENEKKLWEYLDKLEEMTHEKDLDKMDAVKKEYENLKEQAENIESDDIKERLKEKIETMSEYLKKKEQDYEKELRKSGFSRDEEYLYRRYMKIEKELDKDVNKFIKKLEAEIPKLKEFHLEGWYNSWRVTDMNEAWRKIRLKQWWEKLYSRFEEKESLEVNLWICLSVDVSWSMSDNIGDTMRLVIFLWLLCQKWGIPFHVNTFGENLNIIKDTDDEFEERKWKLMRELVANDWWTNIWLSVKKDLDVIEEVKKTHPDTVFLPIFITDWQANEWILWDSLIELMKWFKNLSTMVGIWIDERNLKYWYPNSKVIWLRDSSEIMTVLLKELKQFLKKHKTQIFKVVNE